MPTLFDIIFIHQL